MAFAAAEFEGSGIDQQDRQVAADLPGSLIQSVRPASCGNRLLETIERVQGQGQVVLDAGIGGSQRGSLFERGERLGCLTLAPQQNTQVIPQSGIGRMFRNGRPQFLLGGLTFGRTEVTAETAGSGWPVAARRSITASGRSAARLPRGAR
jgi:hypothetical protein